MVGVFDRTRQPAVSYHRSKSYGLISKALVGSCGIDSENCIVSSQTNVSFWHEAEVSR
jgi:hypothetical protein